MKFNVNRLLGNELEYEIQIDGVTRCRTKLASLSREVESFELQTSDNDFDRVSSRSVHVKGRLKRILNTDSGEKVYESLVSEFMNKSVHGGISEEEPRNVSLVDVYFPPLEEMMSCVRMDPVAQASPSAIGSSIVSRACSKRVSLVDAAVMSGLRKVPSGVRREHSLHSSTRVNFNLSLVHLSLLSIFMNVL
ncbi:hypothetical protein HHI36_004895 [Cryptolaemus montrouzieri]|uniref:Uncharacterized protein n=1 Tax=Cryptolaemus montrouzieri TaxID=559131 RepID=A0ABD2NSU8_9CUCU